RPGLSSTCVTTFSLASITIRYGSNEVDVNSIMTSLPASPLNDTLSKYSPLANCSSPSPSTPTPANDKPHSDNTSADSAAVANRLIRRCWREEKGSLHGWGRGLSGSRVRLVNTWG